MKITIKLFATYRIGRFKEADREYPAGSSVSYVLQSLNLANSKAIMLVNGKPAADSHLLKSGDTLTLFPMISGG